MYRYNENLTDLQKEFIKARKEARERIFEKVHFALICFVIIIGTASLAYFTACLINPEMLVLTTLGAFILIWLIVILILTVMDIICRLINYCKFKYKSNQFDFKVRGILSRNEYDFFKNKYYCIFDFNSTYYMFYINKIGGCNSKPGKEEFDESYNRASMYVNILNKLYSAKISPKKIQPLIKNFGSPLQGFYEGINNYDKVCELFDKITELRNKGDYKIYFENGELKRYD